MRPGRSWRKPGRRGILIVAIGTRATRMTRGRGRIAGRAAAITRARAESYRWDLLCDITKVLSFFLECTHLSNIADAFVILTTIFLRIFFYSQNAPCGAPNSGFPGKAPYLSENSECEWAGSSCDGKDISIIGFEGNNLGGTFPAEILALNKLRNLTLEGGRTSGTIPEEWGSGVWSGDSLQVLDLDQNKLSGPVSDNLFNLQTLKVLDIDENRLEGTLSPRVGRLTNLVFVEFEDNKFEGQIPDTFSKLKKLRKCRLLHSFSRMVSFYTIMHQFPISNPQRVHTYMSSLFHFKIFFWQVLPPSGAMISVVPCQRQCVTIASPMDCWIFLLPIVLEMNPRSSAIAVRRASKEKEWMAWEAVRLS